MRPVSNAPTQTHSYCGIDLVKFLCSFLVIAIHFPPFSEAHFSSAETIDFILARVLARVAVPFFFLCTGFFLLKTIEPDRIMRYCTKVLRFWGVWTMILILGTHNHLWYLKATVLAVICVSFCLRRFRMPSVCLLGLGLYAVGLLGDSYYGLAEPLRQIPLLDKVIWAYEVRFLHTRNGVFMGFPFVLMGAWFARTGFSMKTSHAALGLTVSLAAMTAEAMTLERLGLCKDYNMYLLLLPSAFFLFAFAMSWKLKPRPIYAHLRSIGALNYYAHMMVAKIVGLSFNALIKLAGVSLYPYLYPYLYPVAAAASLVTVTLLYRLSRKEKFTWLQFLYR